MKNILFIVTILITFIACGDEEKRKQEAIDQEVKIAVESYRNKRVKECMMVLLDSANKITDSLIVVKMTAYDTSSLLAKPMKPVKPIIKSPLDTTPVKPIIPKN